MLPKALREKLQTRELPREQQQSVKGGQRVFPSTRSPRVSPRWDEITIRLQGGGSQAQFITTGGGVKNPRFTP